MSKGSPAAFPVSLLACLSAVSLLGIGAGAGLRDQPGQGGKKPAAQFDQASIERGRQHFTKMCAHCHGDDAAGDGPEHTSFIPNPANLTLVRLTPAMFGSIVRNGIPGTAMPSRSTIGDDELRDVYAFVLSRPIDTTVEWARPWRASPETIASGTAEGLYTTMCQGCHGSKDEGDGYWARQNDHVWPKPANFRARNSDVGRLYYVITKGLRGTMMAAQAPKLSDAARWSLAHYVYAMYDLNSSAAIEHGPARRYTNPLASSDKNAVQTGKETYDLYCAYCHGVAGKGTFLAPTLADRDWLFGGGTDNAVFVLLKNGVPGKLMPSHTALDDQRLWSVVAYIRSRGGLQDPLPTEPPEHEEHKEQQK